MRTVMAIILPVLSAAVVYDAMAAAVTASSSGDEMLLLLPAMLVGLLFVALVLLPLWSFFAGGGRARRAAFITAGVTIWLVACGVLLTTGAVEQVAKLWLATSLLVPGLVLVTAFGLLIGRRSF